jgi:chromosome segregation ATPase
MIRSLILASVLILFSAFTCVAQSTGSGAPSQPDPAKPAAQSQSSAPAASPAEPPAPPANAAVAKNQASDKDRTKKKPKKVWTNDEISAVRGKISVVGDPSQSSSYSDSRQWNSASDSGSGGNTEREKAIANYREQLRQLREQQDAIDKKISAVRNFKADNSSPSGGINMRTRYSMTTTDDEIKQLEGKKKQIQAKMDAIEDEARKNGIEPGELR